MSDLRYFVFDRKDGFKRSKKRRVKVAMFMGHWK